MSGRLSHLPYFLVITLLLAAGITGCAAGSAAPPDVAQDSLPPVTGDTPAEVVRLYYDWYLDYARFDPERGSRNNPLVDGAYRDSGYLSPVFIQAIDGQLAGGEIRFDPFLCAQDVPTTVDIVETSPAPDAVQVMISSSLGNTFAVIVEQANDTWQITRVDCSPASAEQE